MDDEKQERMLPFFFENMCKSKMVLPRGFHLSPFEELEPDPLRDCALPTCQKQDDSNWCVLKGCGYSSLQVSGYLLSRFQETQEQVVRHNH